MQICLQRTEHIHKIYSGINPKTLQVAQSGAFRRKIRANDNDILIAHIGALAPEKDFTSFLRTAALMNQKINYPERLHFLVIGQGPQAPQLRKEAIKLGLSNITFTGFIENMPEVFADIDLLLFCPREEGLGTTVIEAMMTSTAVIATRAGGIPELIRHEKEGWLTEIGDIEHLANYAIHALQNEQLRQYIVKAAMERSRLFTAKNMAEKTSEVYREVW
jgi:glycosyltransferase involved in cell wall biosynthesis